MGAAAEHMQREHAEEERRLSGRCCSLEVTAPSQPSVHSPSVMSPEGRHRSCLCSLLSVSVLVWTQPTQEKSTSLDGQPWPTQ